MKISVALRGLAPRYIRRPNREERFRIRTFIQGYSDVPGAVGRIDVRHFNVSKPLNQAAAFRDHHHNYSLKAQAVCAHRLLIRDLYIGEAGSMHDARVFRRSPLCRSILFDEELMEPDESMVGNAACTLLDGVK